MSDIAVAPISKRLAFLSSDRKDLDKSELGPLFAALVGALGLGNRHEDRSLILGALEQIFFEAFCLVSIGKGHVYIYDRIIALSFKLIDASCEYSEDAISLQDDYVDSLERGITKMIEYMPLRPRELLKIYRDARS